MILIQGKNPYNRLYKIFKIEMVDQGLTIKQLAFKLDKTPTTVSPIFTNLPKQSMQLDTFVELCNTLHQDPTTLLKRIGVIL